MQRLASSLLLSAALASTSGAQAPFIHRVDYVDASTPANKLSYQGAISADGQRVLFTSAATNLLSIPAGSDHLSNLYCRDLRTQSLQFVNVDSAGALMSLSVPEIGSGPPASISADGRWVVFHSSSPDAALGDPDTFGDIYLRDLELGTTELISTATIGDSANVHFAAPAISGDGRYVVYLMSKPLPDLPPFGGTDYQTVILHDRSTGTTQAISAPPNGPFDLIRPVPVISLDGSTVAYTQRTTNMGTRVVTYSTITGMRTEYAATASSANGLRHLSIDGTGAQVVFDSTSPVVPGDTNNLPDVHLLTTATGAVTRLSNCYLPGDGYHALEASISPNGRYVAFVAGGTCFTGTPTSGSHVYVLDLETGLFTLQTISDQGAPGHTALSQKLSHIGGPQALSADGEVVVFDSTYKNLATPVSATALLDVSTGIYIRERQVDGPALTLTNLIAGQTATLAIANATPSGPLFVGYSITGQGPFPSYWGLIDLTPPVLSFTVMADAQGDVSLPLTVPPALAGERIWMKALDVLGSHPTTTFMGVVE